jgi:hypothetical protein
MRSRFKPASLVLAILAALLIAAPVAAADPWQTFKQSGTSAFASDVVCTENPNRTVTCEGESLDVFEGTTKQSGQPTMSGERVCYSQFTDTFNPRTGEGESSGVFGCTLDAGTLSIDNLTSITLAPTVIELTALECDSTGCTESPGGTITVQGTWTGVGPIVTQKSRFTFDDGTCIQVNADRGSFRQATFDGSIEATQAMMGQGTFTFRTSCAF